MSNSAARFFLFIIGLLVVLIILMNQWIHKELAETVQPAPPIMAEAPADPEMTNAENYEIDLKDGLDEDPLEGHAAVASSKKDERIPDEKIIYEMPLSNIFLVQ